MTGQRIVLAAMVIVTEKGLSLRPPPREGYSKRIGPRDELVHLGAFVLVQLGKAGASYGAGADLIVLCVSVPL